MSTAAIITPRKTGIRRGGFVKGQVPTAKRKGDWNPPEEEKRLKVYDKIQVGGPDDCWPWTGSLDTSDHPNPVRFGERSAQPSHVVHRDAKGYWPNVARHTCDNPICLNPAHIVDGTTADNMHDRKGESRPKRLSMEKLEEVMTLLDGVEELGMSLMSVSRITGVRYSRVRDIFHGHRYPKVREQLKVQGKIKGWWR